MKRVLAALGLALALLTGRYAGTSDAQQPVVVTHTTGSVGTSSTTIVSASSSQRKLMLVENDSDTVIYCTFEGTDAVVNQGVRLNASGGAVLFDTSVPLGPVKCIHGGSGSKTALVTIGQ